MQKYKNYIAKNTKKKIKIAMLSVPMLATSRLFAKLEFKININY